MNGNCPRCHVPIDMDRQCTALGEQLVLDSVTDPFTDIAWIIAYCWTCAAAMWPDLARTP